MELFKLMCDDGEIEMISDPESVLEVFNLVSDAKLQRKILSKLRFSDCFCFKGEKLIKNLFELSEKLMETFPNTLKGLWQSIVKTDKNNMSIIVHFLIDKLQKEQWKDENLMVVEVVVFVYKAIEEIDGNLVQEMLLRYAHPFVGTQKVYNMTPLEAVIKIIERIELDNKRCERDGRRCERDDQRYERLNQRGIQVLFLNDSKITVKPEELMKWALECPVNKISNSAWRELKKQANSLSNEFIKDFLKGTKKFLQHLVCPATLKYFDPLLVKEILEFYDFVVVCNKKIDFEVIEIIYEMAVIQLSAEDEIVFISSCELIKSCLKGRNNEIEVKVSLYQELTKKPSQSIDLMFELMRIDVNLSIEKYFCFLISFLPFIFRLFEESLNLQLIEQNSFDYSKEMEYLRLLIKMNQRIIIDEAEVDENGNLCLLELGQFLVSMEKQKKRSEIDFYKTIASILATLNKFTLKLICSIEEEKFLVYYFDVLRLETVDIPEDLAFKIAKILASSNENCPIKQRVIDFLIIK